MKNIINRICANAVLVALVLAVSAVPPISSSSIRIHAEKTAEPVDVGIILDLDSVAGKVARSIISTAVSDFYTVHHNYTTRIVPHFRDSNGDDVAAASAALDLLKNVRVRAIFGPLRSSQADFVIKLCNESKVPIISPATSPSLSPNDNKYFTRAALNSASQAEPIAALMKAFGWREVVFIYEDSIFGKGIIPDFTDAMLGVGTRVKYRSILLPTASDDRVLAELYKLKTMQTRVFVVHMLPGLTSRLFVKADEAGMMAEGYVWIITDEVTNVLHSLDPSVIIDSMQGVLGVKPYIPRSRELKCFEYRWKKSFVRENPDMHRVELDMFGVWAYDSIFSLASALERVANGSTTRSHENPILRGETCNTNLYAIIGTSEMGPELLPLIRNIKFIGLSGEFNVMDGELQSSAYQIVNVVGKGEKGIGFWDRKNGFVKKYTDDQGRATNYSADKGDLGRITWPGDTSDLPKGWELPANSEKILRVGVPAEGGFDKFIKVEIDPQTKRVKAEGFCVDVFEEVMNTLPYAVPYEYFPFEIGEGTTSGYYDELVYQIFLENYDAVVGDVTITANRSNYVDFTLPYTESGVSMIVPVKHDDRKSPWIFMRPLSGGLWLITGAFFIYTGIVVWILEHRVNKEFRGLPYKQLGMILWFSFSTLVFAHKEKMISNLSRFVVLVWVFVVLVLTSSYTASLTSMLTVQKLKPEFSDIYDLVRNGDYIGYKSGSFVSGMLKDMRIDESKLRNYTTLQEYDEALTRGSKNGGVSAIVDEIPYIRLFLSKCHTNKYTMVGPTYRTAGFGFAFPNGSPLVPDVSRSVLQVTEKKLLNISKKWFGEEGDCREKDGSVLDSSDRLTVDSFKGLFLIAGISSTSALILFFLRFFYENTEMLFSEDSFQGKLSALIRKFDEEKNQDQSNKISVPAETLDSVVVPAQTMDGVVVPAQTMDGVVIPAQSIDGVIPDDD